METYFIFVLNGDDIEMQEEITLAGVIDGKIAGGRYVQIAQMTTQGQKVSEVINETGQGYHL